jgi:hypothetical protein
VLQEGEESRLLALLPRCGGGPRLHGY